MFYHHCLDSWSLPLVKAWHEMTTQMFQTNWYLLFYCSRHYTFSIRFIFVNFFHSYSILRAGWPCLPMNGVKALENWGQCLQAWTNLPSSCSLNPLLDECSAFSFRLSVIFCNFGTADTLNFFSQLDIMVMNATCLLFCWDHTCFNSWSTDKNALFSLLMLCLSLFLCGCNHV